MHSKMHVSHELIPLKTGSVHSVKQHRDRQPFTNLPLAQKGQSRSLWAYCRSESLQLPAHLGMSRGVAFSEGVGGNSLTCNNNVNTYLKDGWPLPTQLRPVCLYETPEQVPCGVREQGRLAWPEIAEVCVWWRTPTSWIYKIKISTNMLPV